MTHNNTGPNPHTPTLSPTLLLTLSLKKQKQKNTHTHQVLARALNVYETNKEIETGIARSS